MAPTKQPYLSDEEIIELYLGRDERAITETERKYGSALLRVARGILHDELDCEECVSDAYLGVWNAIPPTRPRSLAAFATGILRRIAINRYHENTAQKRVPSAYTVSLDELAEVLCAPDSAEAEAEAAELGRLINAYLAGLRPRERTLFVGRYYMARTLEDLAEERRVHLSTVHRELGRLREGLRKFLERNGIEV